MEDGSGATVSDVSSAGNSLDGTKASSQTDQPAWDTTTKVLGSTSLFFDHPDDDAVILLMQRTRDGGTNTLSGTCNQDNFRTLDIVAHLYILQKFTRIPAFAGD